MAVVLPAPFGPKNPKISPESTRREKLSSARTVRPENQLRYSLVMPSYSRTAGTLGPFYRSLDSASDYKVVTNGLELTHPSNFPTPQELELGAELNWIAQACCRSS